MEAMRNQERDPIIHEANGGYFSDDELQDWYEVSAFGTGAKDKRFSTAKAQMESKFAERAGAIIAARIMMLSVGLWLTIGLVVLEVLIRISI